MLKIKDSVDLKELEKFGFYLEGNTYKKDIGHHKCIAICYIDRIIIIPKLNKWFLKSKDIIKYTIKELIEAGLVEKVEE